MLVNALDIARSLDCSVLVLDPIVNALHCKRGFLVAGQDLSCSSSCSFWTFILLRHAILAVKRVISSNGCWLALASVAEFDIWISRNWRKMNISDGLKLTQCGGSWCLSSDCLARDTISKEPARTLYSESVVGFGSWDRMLYGLEAHHGDAVNSDVLCVSKIAGLTWASGCFDSMSGMPRCSRVKPIGKLPFCKISEQSLLRGGLRLESWDVNIAVECFSVDVLSKLCVLVQFVWLRRLSCVLVRRKTSRRKIFEVTET